MKISIENIPPEIRAVPQWIVWRWIEREGIRTKPPFDARNGRPGDATDPRLWLTFDNAIQVSAKFDGIGFSVTLSSPYSGVDLDHCLDEEGNLAPWAYSIVTKLDSYTEITPSGRGLRIWVKGKLPPGRRRKGAVEMYDSGRYFTVTGRHFEGTPRSIEDRQTELNLLHDEIFGKGDESARKTTSTPLPAGGFLASDEEIIEKAKRSRGGDRFAALMAGDISAYENDDSSADLALCSRLAFWFGGDVDAIDRVFRSSGLYREKWERADYRERTIAKSLEGTSFYEPSATVAFKKTDRSGTNGACGAVPGLRFAEVVPSLPPYPLTDLGNAERLVARSGRDIRYVHPWSKWLRWDGKRWAIDQVGAVRQLAKGAVREIHREAADVDDDATFKALVKWAKDSEDVRKINAMVRCAESEKGVPVLPEHLDTNRWVLNCLNGTLDLRYGVLGPHLREDMITQLCPVEFDPGATCPDWESTLSLVFSGNQDLVKFWQMLCGLALTGDVSEQYLPILYGKGSNGKSTLVNTLMGLLGPDYAMKAPPDLLMIRKGDVHPTERVGLYGKRLVVAIETEEGRRINETMVKELTGSDPITARRMREDFWTFNPTHKLFLCTNHRPVIRGTDHAIWRRLQLIPFTVTIPDEDAIKDMPIRLEAEYPGILAWCVRGCRDWRTAGRLISPDAVTDATKQYRSEEDTIGEFLASHCVFDPQFRVKASDLYARYCHWTEGSGEFKLSQKRFGTVLTDRGFERKTNNGTWYLGLGLEPKNEEPGDF